MKTRFISPLVEFTSSFASSSAAEVAKKSEWQ